MDFASTFRRLRKERGMTQEAVALACGWGQSRIGNYESGKRASRLDELPRLAEALGVSVSAFFDEALDDMWGKVDAKPDLRVVMRQTPAPITSRPLSKRSTTCPESRRAAVKR